jgi:hypothetical protein
MLHSTIFAILNRDSFDTIKVRLQTTDKLQFKGPWACLSQTLKNEGIKGLYKGATPPLVGWMFMDSLYVERWHIISIC